MFEGMDKEVKREVIYNFLIRMIELNQRSYEPPHNYENIKEQHEQRLKNIESDLFTIGIQAISPKPQKLKQHLIDKEEEIFNNKLKQYGIKSRRSSSDPTKSKSNS